ncbi:MAG: glycosyl transferase family 1, partial [Acidobacteria bacterium]
MRLAYFSPLTPQRSGIADYSEELLPHLSEGAEITLFVDGFEPTSRSLRARLPVRDFRRDPSLLRSLAEFDAVVYHM